MKVDGLRQQGYQHVKEDMYRKFEKYRGLKQTAQGKLSRHPDDHSRAWKRL